MCTSSNCTYTRAKYSRYVDIIFQHQLPDQVSLPSSSSCRPPPHQLLQQNSIRCALAMGHSTSSGAKADAPMHVFCKVQWSREVLDCPRQASRSAIGHWGLCARCERPSPGLAVCRRLQPRHASSYRGPIAGAGVGSRRTADAMLRAQGSRAAPFGLHAFTVVMHSGIQPRNVQQGSCSRGS